MKVRMFESYYEEDGFRTPSQEEIDKYDLYENDKFFPGKFGYWVWNDEDNLLVFCPYNENSCTELYCEDGEYDAFELAERLENQSESADDIVWELSEIHYGDDEDNEDDEDW